MNFLSLRYKPLSDSSRGSLKERPSSERRVLNGEECKWAEWKIGVIADISVKGRFGDISCTAVGMKHCGKQQPLTEAVESVVGESTVALW